MGDQYDVRYGLSIPNRWSNTPWLTFNHPRLNQFRRVRLTQALMAWSEARRRLIDVGKGRLLPGQLTTGDETIYWAKGVDDSEYTKLNKGIGRTRLMADFNPFVIADAQKENVRLDPRDGLDPGERYWLHRNLARQQQRIVGWMFEALPAEPIVLEPPAAPDEKNVPFYAVDLARRNLFTEPYAMSTFPTSGITPFHPGLELGYVAEG